MTKVRCKDLPHSDLGDFRCWRAVDSSSWFSELFVTCSAPSHFPNQCWLVNWILRNKFLLNFNKNTMHLQLLPYVCKMLNRWNWFSLNSLWSSNAVWCQRSWSTLLQVMACWLMVPSHYLNQCWMLINEVPWYSPQSNFTVSAQVTILYNEFENYIFKMTTTATCPRGQWVNSLRPTDAYMRLMHICVIIGLDNGLAPGWRQAII